MGRVDEGRVGGENTAEHPRRKVGRAYYDAPSGKAFQSASALNEARLNKPHPNTTLQPEVPQQLSLLTEVTREPGAHAVSLPYRRSGINRPLPGAGGTIGYVPSPEAYSGRQSWTEHAQTEGRRILRSDENNPRTGSWGPRRTGFRSMNKRLEG